MLTVADPGEAGGACLPPLAGMWPSNPVIRASGCTRKRSSVHYD